MMYGIRKLVVMVMYHKVFNDNTVNRFHQFLHSLVTDGLNHPNHYLNRSLITVNASKVGGGG